VGEEDEVPAADTMAEEGEEPRGYPIAPFCGENAGHFTKDCKYNKMARQLKEKDEAARSNETSSHVFHNAGHEMVNS
jgi:hypothetical protein